MNGATTATATRLLLLLLLMLRHLLMICRRSIELLVMCGSINVY